MQTLISVDFKGDFGFFRKPDANNTINLSYNMIHKPSILGIFGAIVGLDGYKEKGVMPQYYNVFKDLKIGIEPVNHDKGNFQKTVIKYSNTVGYANNGATYLTEEATLIKPYYRIYIILNTESEFENKLLNNLRDGQTEFIPYFGKNEFHMWWNKDSFKIYNDFEENVKPSASIMIKSIFMKSSTFKDHKEEPLPDLMSMDIEEIPFIYFERLPQGFDTKMFQYDLGEYVYTTFKIKNSYNLNGLYFLKKEGYYVQII